MKLPDAACERVRTVADLAALVFDRLQDSNGVCPTARAFFEFRSLMVTQAGFERRQVRPKVQLIELFPPGSRRRWNSLRGRDRRVPGLVTSAGSDSVRLLTLSVIAYAWLLTSAALRALLGADVAVPLSMAVFALGCWAFQGVNEHFAQHFPPGIETVGDVARHIAPIEIRQCNSGQRLVAQQRVLDEVRKLTAQQLRLPLERVQPTTDFVRDLKIN